MIRSVASIVVLAALLAGCSTSEQQQRAGTGALVGAAGGALVGQALGRDTKSTLIGAAAGGALGAGVGAATAPKQCQYQDAYGRIYTAPCDNRYR